MLERDLDPSARRGFRLRLWAARAAVSFEHAYPALWPAFAIAGGFLALAWLGLLEPLPDLLHFLIVLAAGGGLALALVRGVRQIRIADRDAGLARLERDSRLRHQALRALGDRLPDAVVDPTTRALWRVHRERLRRSLAALKLAPPRSDMPRRDPWALRAVLLLALVVALVEGYGEYGARLAGAFVPWRPVQTPVVTPQVTLWVTPPAYTRRAPLAAEQTAALDLLEVPVGSVGLLQVHDLPAARAGQARLTVGDGEQPFKILGDGSIEARPMLEADGRLTVTGPDGAVLRAWTVLAIPDKAPVIAFAGNPRGTQRGVLRVGYEASDDYGLVEIGMELAAKARPDAVEAMGLAKPGSQPVTLKTGSYLDLTPHPLAGLPTLVTLTAKDAVGQIGRSRTIEIVLPEREFKHPLAKAVIEQRKRMVAEPDKRRDIGARLAVLATTPMAQQMLTTVPLTLNVVGARARNAATPEAQRGVVDLLWELALFIEDGDLSTSERDLRALQERLQRAFEQNASDAELERLMQELQQALDRFLQELAERAMRQAEQMTPEQREQMQRQRVDPSQMVDRNDLQKMLDRAREMMRSGARDAAKDQLAQLQRMLENLQAQMAQPQQATPQEQSLSDLQRMIQMQQSLLDRSFQMQREQGQQGQEDQQQGRQGQRQQGQQPGQRQQGQQGQQGQRGQQQGQRGQQQGQRGQQGQQQGQGQPGDSPGQAAGEQEALRRALGELMRRMGEAGMEIPRSLGQAEMQMRGARGALEQGQPGEATQPQSSALDLMQQGAQAMLDQMQQQMGQQMGPGPGQEPMSQGRRGRDPLGRAQYNDGGCDPHNQFVPEDADLGRARDVLEELYKRSGQRQRPQQELDYYNRLLDRF